MLIWYIKGETVPEITRLPSNFGTMSIKKLPSVI